MVLSKVRHTGLYRHTEFILVRHGTLIRTDIPAREDEAASRSRARRCMLINHFFLNSVIRGIDWGDPSAKNCYRQIQPVNGSTYPGGPVPAQGIVKSVLSAMTEPVYLLDITLLSQLRKDAHPSAYSGDHAGMDCSHWCLSGLPDTWNQILYAALL
ncbi:hypothetical protein BHE74_00035687 [Ensete ventricosum]|nr:hypothetical protein BHE74_00035687 [Ensete ventricosum]